MVNLGVDFAESIESVLAKVQETPRGRWFIEGLEAKVRSSETTRILNAVARLEDHVQQLSQGNMDSQLVNRARAAIAAARNDISSLENADRSGLSNEAQLFAKLAMQSTQSQPQEKTVGAGIERALKLVAELDRDFSMPTVVKPRDAAKFFAQDAGIFDAPAKPVLKTVAQIEAKPEAQPAPVAAKPKAQIALSLPKSASDAAPTTKTKTPISQRMKSADQKPGAATAAKPAPQAAAPKKPTGLRFNVAAPAAMASTAQTKPVATPAMPIAPAPKPMGMRFAVPNQVKPSNPSRIILNRVRPEDMHGAPMMDMSAINRPSPAASLSN